MIIEDLICLNFILAAPTSIETSINAIGPPVAGYNFTLTCTVTLIEGLFGIPQVLWINSNGQQINSSGDVILNDPVTSSQSTNLTLYFDPIRTSDGGTYTCLAILPLFTLTTVLNSSATYFINVQKSELLVQTILSII